MCYMDGSLVFTSLEVLSLLCSKRFVSATLYTFVSSNRSSLRSHKLQQFPLSPTPECYNNCSESLQHQHQCNSRETKVVWSNSVGPVWSLLLTKNDRRSSRGTLQQKKTRLNLIWASISIVSINQHLPASISTSQHQSESISINWHQSASITISQHQSATISISISINQNL